MNRMTKGTKIVRSDNLAKDIAAKHAKAKKSDMPVNKKANKKTRILILAALVFILCLFSLNSVFLQKQGMVRKDPCISPYAWDPDIGACARRGLDAGQKQAASIAIAPLSYPINIVDVEVLGCMGCFDVTIQRTDNNQTSTTRLRDWKFAFECEDYDYINCPDSCAVCPPCEMCNSLACRSEDFCTSIGFGRDWYENITMRLDEPVD